MHRFWNRLSLNRRLALVMVVTGLLLVTCIVSSVLIVLYRQYTGTLSRQQETLLEGLAQGIDDQLHASLDALAGVALVTPHTTLTDPVAAQRFLSNRTGIQSIFDNGLALFTRTGRLMAETPYYPDRTIREFAEYPFFKQAFKEDKPIISIPFRSTKPPHHPVVQLLAPIKNSSGATIGFLSGGVRLDQPNFLGSLAQRRVGSSGYLYLYNKDRTMLVHPDPTRILGTTALPGVNHLLDRAISGWSGSGTTVNSRRIKQIASFRQLTQAPWILAATFSEQEAAAPLYNAAVLLVALIAGLGSIGAGISWWLTQRLTAPLADFAVHLQHLPQLAGSARYVQPQGGPELEILAASLNRMVAELDQQQETIQQQMDELIRVSAEQHRTAQLLRLITDNVPDLIWAKDLQGNYLFTNLANARLLLLTDDTAEPIGKNHEEYSNRIRAERPDQKDWYSFGELCGDSDKNVLKELTAQRFEEYGNVQGQFLHMDVYKAPFFDQDGVLLGTVGCGRVITREKQLEQETRRLARLYRILSAINQKIVHKPPPTELFQFVCATLVSDDNFVMAWIGVADGAGGYTPVAAAGITLDMLKEFRGSEHLQAVARGGDGTMIMSTITPENAELMLCNCCASLYKNKPFGSQATYQITPDRTGAALLVVYAAENNFFDHDEQSLMDELVGDLAYALEMDASEQKLTYLSWYDPLTDLPNRQMACSLLTQALARAQRQKTSLALLCLDLDHFKDINDSFGHPTGDALLCLVAQRLQQQMRVTDTVARLGGDEFIVLLEGVQELSTVVLVAEDLVSHLQEPFQLENLVELRIGVSIGIALFPDHAQTTTDLLQAADSALFRAKQRGRGGFALFSEELTAQATERIQLGNRLRRAVELNELRVVYQPQVELATGKIIGAEALMRWQSQDMGLLMPARFIPLAEEIGCIVPMGEWILRQTCQQGRAWLDAGLGPISLSVNLSAHQFHQVDICQVVADVLHTTGFPAELLELEVTESALMQPGKQTIKLLHGLRKLGVRLALDDFGTGYSSLAYLKHFPLHMLKIDKSFVDDIPQSNKDLRLVSTIVFMARSMEFKVLAEGVERQDQLDALKELGCDLYQGYFSSKPVPADEFAALLKQSL
ncbi:MAG: EAL domain-containing protein [Geobacteraceae bacterium]|nr:EAL domain-containing protein [Geobacteraceae bacterium]